MTWSLEGRTALVTGGAGGIGSAIVGQLAAMGARVAVLDISTEGAEKVAAEHGGRAFTVDLCDAADVERSYEAVCTELGAPAIVVNNAGWDRPGPFLDTDAELWDLLLALNLRAPMQLTQLALPAMVEAGHGRLIYISSDAGRVGSKGEAVYSACKAGIIGFAKTIAREVARSGITANAVCPGPTDTPLMAEALEENPKLVTALNRAVPMGRIGLPSDVAPAVGFLATDEAGYITGQTLSVSGGLTMA